MYIYEILNYIIKNFFYNEANPCTCPKDLPQCICGKKPRIKIVERLIKSTDDEVQENPSARSARLRVVEKI